MRVSRVGGGAGALSLRRPGAGGGSRMSTTEAMAAVRLSPARATKAASSPRASITLGRVSDARAPPSGSAI